MTATEPVFNEVIHAPQRLRICAMLSGAQKVEFRLLQDRLGLSKSALSRHLALLVDAVVWAKLGRSQTEKAATMPMFGFGGEGSPTPDA